MAHLGTANNVKRIRCNICYSLSMDGVYYACPPSGQEPRSPRVQNSSMPHYTWLLATSSSADAMTSSTVMVCFAYLRSRMSPISSVARSSRSMSFLVCEADRQNRIREVMSGVALCSRQQELHSEDSPTYGYATTTTATGVLSAPTRPIIISENRFILPGWYTSSGIIGLSRCP